MSPGEAVKGQSLFTMMFTFSTIIASFAGGWILDASGAKALTFAVYSKFYSDFTGSLDDIKTDVLEKILG